MVEPPLTSESGLTGRGGGLERTGAWYTYYRFRGIIGAYNSWSRALGAYFPYKHNKEPDGFNILYIMQLQRALMLALRQISRADLATWAEPNA